MSVVLIMAGGTGGHVYPALAVAKELRAQGVAITWLGAPQSFEAAIAAAAGIPFFTVTVRGLRGKSFWRFLAAPFELLRAVWQSLRHLKTIKPHCVIGFGGFAAGPGGVAALLTRIPLVLHEQNAIPGLTNRLLARFAKAVCVGFARAFQNASLRYRVVTGNPVRQEVCALNFQVGRYTDTRPLRVLVLGGSLGARVFNEVMPKVLALMPTIQVWHQTGVAQFAAACANYGNVDKSTLRIEPFIEQMAEGYAWADVVLCRGGAMTVSELMAAGVPAMIVPLPHAVDDHQAHNANVLVERGAARLIRQETLTPDLLVAELKKLDQNRTLLEQMAQAAWALRMPAATQKVAAICQQYLN